MATRIVTCCSVLVLAAFLAAPTMADATRGLSVRRTAAKSSNNKRALSPDKQQILDQLPENASAKQRKDLQKKLQDIQERQRVAKKTAEKQAKIAQKDAERRFSQQDKERGTKSKSRPYGRTR